MLKKILRRSAWTIGILLVVALLVHAAAVLYTGWLLEGELVARRAAGLPVTFHDLTNPTLSPEDNAAVQLDLAVPWAQGINQDLHEVVDSDEYAKGILGKESAAKVEALADVYARLIPPLRRAAEIDEYQSLALADLPDGAHTLATERMIERNSSLRCVSRALRLRAMQLLTDERRAEAFDMLLLSLSMARKLRHEPAIMGCLMGSAYARDAQDLLAQLVAAQPLTREERRRLDQELARQDDLTSVDESLQSEAVFGLAMLGDLSRTWFARPLGQYWQYQYLRSAALWNQRFDQGLAEPDGSADATNAGFPVALLAPALKAFARSVGSNTARTRSLRALIALQAALAADPNDIPTIDKLGLPLESVRDPFSRESLRLKQTNSGWLIYSVGSDGVDNGGTFDQDHDVGYLLPTPATERSGT